MKSVVFVFYLHSLTRQCSIMRKNNVPQLFLLGLLAFNLACSQNNQIIPTEEVVGEISAKTPRVVTYLTGNAADVTPTPIPFTVV